MKSIVRFYLPSMNEPLQKYIPRKGAGYLKAQSVFFRQFNDVDFYSEDDSMERFYFEIFKKLFPTIRLDRVFGLGGKLAVIEAAQKDTRPNSIYVVDKDFDDLLKSTEHLPNLFYLKHFCIENYLLEKDAVTKFLLVEKPRLKEAHIKKRLDFDRFLKQTVSRLYLLFALFFMVQKHSLGLPNTGQNAEAFSKKRRWLIDGKKILGYKDKVCSTYLGKGKYSRTAFNKQLHLLKLKINRTKMSIPENISGKYIIQFLIHWLRHAFGINSIESDSLRMKLAKECSFSSLNYLKHSIETHLITRK